MAVCLAGGLVAGAGLRAAGPAAGPATAPAVVATAAVTAAPAANPSLDNPYAAIVARNIFGLVPPPPPPSPEETAEKNLPKITLTGIMSELDQSQALFKVGAKPGVGNKEQFYTLSEGERQDDIEVVKIDPVKGVVTFDNHGFTQEIPLTEGQASGGPGATPASSPMMPPPLASRAGGGNNGGGGFTQFGASSGGPNVAANANGTPGFNGGADSNPDAAPANSLQSHIYQPQPSTLTPEESVILLEANRAALMNNPHPPYSPSLLPTSPLTKFTTGEAGGSGQQ